MNWHTLLILAVFMAGMLTTSLLMAAWCTVALRRERREHDDVIETLKTPRWGP